MLPQKSREAIRSERLIGDVYRFYMLMLLYEQPRSGYELMMEIGKRLDKRMSPSIVYPFLSTLESMGLIAPKTFSVGQRDRNVNTLTASGRAMCLRLFKKFTSLFASAIEPALVECPHCGSEVFSGAYYATVDGKRTAFCCEYCAASFRRSGSHRNARAARRSRQARE